MITHKLITENLVGKDYFVGDIHGELALLMRALQRCRFDFDQDRLFSVGDIIDRGPQSLKTLELLNEKWFFAVLGNHEEMLLAEDGHAFTDLHKKTGGEWFYDLKPEQQAACKSLIKQQCSYALTIDTALGSIGISHANAPADWRIFTNSSASKSTMDANLLDKVVWSTAPYAQVRKGELSLIANIDVTIHGHVNCSQVVTNRNQLWIDTLRKTKRLTVLSAKQVFSII